MSEPILLFEIDGFPKYFVGTDSNIYSEKSGNMRKMDGSDNGRGYYIVSLRKDGKEYSKSVHRLIAQMFIANPNNLPQVDHINQDRTDNRLENLRWVTKKDNDRNRGMRIDNTSGEQGVSFDKYQNCWKAQWHDNQGKRKSKTFPINKYGDTQAKQLAIDIRNKMVDELYNRPT